jgi:predicted ATPase
MVRNFTITMTMRTLFGVSNDLSQEWKVGAIQVVGNYFKAWEFFLLTPQPDVFPDLQRTHTVAVRAMHALGEEIVRMDHHPDSFVPRLRQRKLPECEVVQNVCELLLAGADTSSLTLYYTLCFVADKGFHSRDVKNLYYEAMRLLPVGPVIMRQATAGFEVSPGFELDKGEGIVFNIAGMNLTSHYAQPTRFDPTRYERDETKPLSFGTGLKSCTGRAFAEKEMELFLQPVLKEFTILSPHASAIDMLQPQWDVANAPLHDVPLTFFPRKLLFLVGQSSTGKTTVANALQAAYPRLMVYGEVARRIMDEHGWTRDNLDDDETFFELQRLIVDAHTQLLSQWSGDFAVVDRSVVDALYFCRMRFGVESARSKQLEELVRGACTNGMANAVILHFPFKPSLVEDDGTRLPSLPLGDASFLACLDALGLEYHTLQASSTADRVEELLRVVRESFDMSKQ